MLKACCNLILLFLLSGRISEVIVRGISENNFGKNPVGTSEENHGENPAGIRSETRISKAILGGI